jgi:hypothetical protein
VETIGERRLRLAVLARQGLLERSADSVPAILSRTAGLQSQHAPSPYIGLSSRLEGFSRDDLTAALESRTAVLGTMVRGTLHVVAAEDYWPINIAVRDIRRAWCLGARRSLRNDFLVAAATRIRFELAENGGVLPHRRLVASVGKELAPYVGLWIDLVRVPPSGTWTRPRANLYAAAVDWVGPEPEMSLGDARDQLVRHYLTGFGPASYAEVASFCSMNVGSIRAAVDRVATTTFLAEDGTQLFDLEGLPLPRDDDVEPRPRFLGTWEALLLAHARRAQILPDVDRRRIFRTTLPQSLPTFLVDGQVAGTWKYADGQVTLDHWRPVPERWSAVLSGEVERLVALHR